MDELTPARWRKLVRTVARRLGRESDAEDLVQEAYARLLEHSRTNFVHNPDGFVVRAATNLGISFMRRDVRKAAAHADEAVVALLQPGGAPQDDILAARESLRLVQEAIDGLPPRAREVFVLHRIEGLTYSEIAQSLGISVSGVEKHVARALTQLSLHFVEMRPARGPRH